MIGSSNEICLAYALAHVLLIVHRYIHILLDKGFGESR